ncbi:MAG: PQQ-dependent sugar dehydrogenase [Hyphomonas sp.]
MAGALAVAACGGGSSPSPPPPPPAANRAPVITSPSSVTIDETATGPVYTLTATDPDGDPVTFHLIAGADEAVFSFNASTGVLSLPAALDVDNPQDAGGNNVYEVVLEARDNRGGIARITLEVRVESALQGMALRRVATGFSQPLYLAGIPGTSQVVVLEKGGRARLFNPDTATIGGTDFLNLSGQLVTASEGGLLGLAFSPDFATDRTVYLNVTANGALPGGGTGLRTEIRRYQTFAGSLTQLDPSTVDVILTIPQPQGNHNAGWLGFGGDGLLYIPTGDGGGAGDPGGNALNPDSLLGKVLRIDVSGDDFPSDAERDYRIPAGNAFPGGVGGAPEIFALGLRNPFRSSFDPQTGDLFIADVGQNAIEEINRMRPGDSGANYGWNRREGTQAYSGGANSPDFTPPVAEYGHGTGPLQGRSITGGYVYRGTVTPIRNHYVFGDFISANVWAVPETSLVNGQTLPASQFTRLNNDLVPDQGTLGQISSFGLDNQGRLYIVSLGGSVFRVERAP